MKMKSKLLAVTCMLVVSVLMMSTASFAWFTISTAPEISGLDTTVVTNENLEIALASNYESLTAMQTAKGVPGASAIADTGKMTTWGNLIDLKATSDTATKTAYENLIKILRPAQLSLKDGSNIPEGQTKPTVNTFQYPTYGADGRPSNFANLNTDSTVSMGNLSVSDGTNTEVYGYYIDVWFRSNMGGAVTFTSGETAGIGVERSDEGAVGKGSYIESTNRVLADNLRVAVQVLAKATWDYAGAATVTLTTGDATAITQMTTTQSTAEGEKYTNKITGTVTTLTANEAQLVRIYVYLDGAKVTNAAASIDTAIVNGTLNLQFTMANVDHSMDGQNNNKPTA